MATSPNYGWLEPDNTDLVKNGALAIRTLGNAIDTTMATMTPKSLVDAKGDLVTATANDTPARLAVGANGETLVADSSTATGLSYQSNFAAGKNKIINGDFRIWQRGASITIGVGSYWADRYSMDMITAVPTGTASRQTFTPGAAPVAGYEGSFFGRINITAANGCTQFYINQKVEDVRTFAGQTVTLSAWLKADATSDIGVYLIQNFGTGGSSPVVTTVSSVTNITNGWIRYNWTVAVPSISGKTIGTNPFLEMRFVISNGGGATVRLGTYDFWGVQVEAGTVATSFQTATGTIQGELAACQRYYFRTQPAASTRYALGMAKNTTTSDLVISNPVTMRVSPTALEQSGTAGDYGILYLATGAICSAVPVIVAASNKAITLTFTVGAVLTAGQATIPYAVTANGYLGWSAEL